MLRRVQQVRSADGGRAAAVAARAPAAICLSAQSGEGATTCVRRWMQRLSLDTQRVTLEFDEQEESDRQRIAQAVSSCAACAAIMRPKAACPIEADMPRRLLGRLTAVAVR